MKNQQSITEKEHLYETVGEDEVQIWFKAARVKDFAENGGACIIYKGLQIAIFNFTQHDRWFAVQNLCPHKRQMILSRGIIGSHGKELKVACPYHKKTFSLNTGENLNDNLCALATYPVKVEEEMVYVGFKN